MRGVIESLYWDAYWNRLENLRLPLKAELSVNVIWAPDIAGYCSQELDRCSMNKVHPGRGSVFVTRYDPLIVAGQARWEDKSLLDRKGSVEVKSSEVRRAVLSCSYLLNRADSFVPSSIRQRKVPESADSLVQFLQTNVAWPSVDSRLIIPFYSPSDPIVYILIVSSVGRPEVGAVNLSTDNKWAFASRSGVQGANKVLFVEKILKAEMLRIGKSSKVWK